MAGGGNSPKLPFGFPTKKGPVQDESINPFKAGAIAQAAPMGGIGGALGLSKLIGGPTDTNTVQGDIPLTTDEINKQYQDQEAAALKKEKAKQLQDLETRQRGAPGVRAQTLLTGDSRSGTASDYLTKPMLGG